MFFHALTDTYEIGCWFLCKYDNILTIVCCQKLDSGIGQKYLIL